MFSDIAGSTAMTERLDPEDMMEIIRAYQAEVRASVEAYNGFIARYVGDGVLIYFGYPQAHEDDAARALHASLRIAEGVERVNKTLGVLMGVPLAVRIGVATGLVVVGEMLKAGASEEASVVGSTPNLAARLQGLAEPGQIVISSRTQKIAGEQFSYSDLGRQDIRGFDKPIGAYAVLGESQTGSASRPAGSATAFVGRGAELALLLDRWDRAEQGDGQVVLICGDPGIGKSRLIQALDLEIARQDPVRLNFQCSPYHTNSAFHPVIEQFAQVIGLERDNSVEVKLGKLVRAIEPLGFAHDEVLTLLARLLSIPVAQGPDATQHLNPQQQRQRTLEVLAALLFELAGRRPVLMVWEDLHWADPSSLVFLTLLMDQVAVTRVLILLNFRPDFVPPWPARSYVSQLTLDRLTGQQAETMISQMVHASGLPPEVVRQVVEKTDGVPLFIEELLKMILESGLLREEGGRYVPTGPLPSLAIPTTLQDSLMARLDRLSTAREVAQIGAAIGREFSHDMIQAVAMMDEATLVRGLAQLLCGEIIYRRGRPPATTYIFKHALIRDAAYQSLLKSRRYVFHLRIAQALTDRSPEIVANEPELLAHHFAEAGQHEQAILHWQRAAQRSIEKSANSEGIAYLRHALHVLQSLPEGPARAQHELELRVMLGVPLIATSGYANPEVEQTYARARKLSLQVPETPQLPNILWGLWVFYLCGGPLAAALEMGEQYLALADAHPDDTAINLEACQLLGIAHFYRGEFESALPYLERGGQLYDPAQHHKLIFAHGGADTGVAIRVHLALTLWALGFPHRAQQTMRAAMDIARQVSHPFSLAFAHYFNAWFHKLSGEEPAALDAATVALSICEEYGFPFWGLTSAVLRASTSAEQGRTDEGITEMQAKLGAYAAIGGLLHRAPMRGLLARAYAAGGRHELALQEVTGAIADLEGRDERWYESELHRLQGEYLLALDPGNPARAEAALRRALDVALAQNARSWALRAADSLARLLLGQGHNQEAQDLLAEVGAAVDCGGHQDSLSA